MIKLISSLIKLSIKNHELKYIDKQCDKYFKIKRKLESQQHFINELIDLFEKTYGESIRNPKGRGESK